MSANITNVEVLGAAALPPMPLRCRLGLHRWSVWSEVRERPTGFVSFTERYQVSECRKCRAQRQRRVLP